jgi:hypothetical protein
LFDLKKYFGMYSEIFIQSQKLKRRVEKKHWGVKRKILKIGHKKYKEIGP